MYTIKIVLCHNGNNKPQNRPRLCGEQRPELSSESPCPKAFRAAVPVCGDFTFQRLPLLTSSVAVKASCYLWNYWTALGEMWYCGTCTKSWRLNLILSLLIAFGLWNLINVAFVITKFLRKKNFWKEFRSFCNDHLLGYVYVL